MSDKKRTRVYQSGSQKRKLAAIKEKTLNDVLEKIPKISNYFSTHQKPGTSKDITNTTSSETSATSPSTSDSVPAASMCPAPTEINLSQESNPELEDNFKNDVGLWTAPYSNDMIDFWIKQGQTGLQHCDGELFSKISVSQTRPDGKGCSSRKCIISLFYRTLQNKERVNRFWLCFSPSTGKVYCYICKLMSIGAQSNLAGEGFCNWKHASERLISHETSKIHVDSVVAFSIRSKELARIDHLLQQEVIYF